LAFRLEISIVLGQQPLAQTSSVTIGKPTRM
jgi:hypothetical protein